MKRNVKMIVIGLMALMAASFSFVEGEFLTVVANSGLKLRISPSAEASMLKVIPFGEQVKVINSSEMTSIRDRINWLDGHWIQVEHNGVRGYVFDGFLTHLPVPDYDSEKIQADFIIALPLESYVKNKLMKDIVADTLSSGDSFSKYVFMDSSGINMATTEDEYYYEVDIYLPETRITEGFNLLVSMTESRFERQLLLDNAVFIEGENTYVKEVRINGGAITTIKKEGINGIRIKSLVRYFDGC